MAKDLRSSITNLSKGKRIQATVVEVNNDLASVRIGTSGQVLQGLNIVGGQLAVGDSVYVNYSSGTPVIESYARKTSKVVTKTIRTVTRNIIPDTETENSHTGQEVGTHTHLQNQITDLDHDAYLIQGKPVVTSYPIEGQLMAFIDGAWTPVAIVIPPFDPATPGNNQTLVWSNGKWIPTNFPEMNAVKIKGVPVVLTDPQVNQVLTFYGDKFVNMDQQGSGGDDDTGHIIQLNRTALASKTNLNFIGDLKVENNDSFDSTDVYINGSAVTSIMSAQTLR
jgi:hypothetical protein